MINRVVMFCWCLLLIALPMLSCGGEDTGECCEICTHTRHCEQDVTREECDVVIARNKKISGCVGKFYPY